MEEDMRGTVAKRLRNKARKNSLTTTEWVKTKEGTVFYLGYRALYQELKKKYKNGDR